MPTPPEPIAIVGMSCVFPGAANLEKYWSNIERGVDSIGEVPPGRWDPSYYDPSSDAADRFYCRRGGFIDAEATFDPLAFGVMPRAADGADPDQLLALSVAQSAVTDAQLPLEGEWRRDAGVVLGRGGYITPGLARLDQRVRTADQIVEVLKTQAPGLGPDALREIKVAFQAQLGPYGPDTAIGLVPNLAASRIANRLDFSGPAYTVDAACASALLAVDHACRELWSGRCKVMLAGGVHLCQDVTFWSVFTQLGALSRSQQIRPFDRRADGILIGEGVGIVVLKRLEDARRDGDRVYATLRGIGVASDGRGAALLNPRVEGQVLALERAWSQAGADPRTAQLLEAHGTGTAQGDQVELTSLARFFGPSEGAPRAALGSVKSMIGHAMPAAGAAGLIKAALALHHRVLPPSLHCDEPHPLLEKTRFRIPTRAEPWEGEPGGVRRAGVNAFGFGGINAHVVLEKIDAPSRRRAAARAGPNTESESWLAVSASSPAEMVEALAKGENLADPGPYRLVLFNPSAERRESARKVVMRERPWRGHDDIWFSPRGLLSDGGKLAFLFPGLEPTFEPKVDDVAEYFGLPAPPSASGGIETAGAAVIAVSRLLAKALRKLGVAPHAMAGHSVGEWTGMVESEMIPPDAIDGFVASLVPGSLEVPDVIFVAAGCSHEQARAAGEGLSDIALSHDNCPHQVILCGREDSVEVVLSRFRELQVLAQKLPFRSGFHSPLFGPYLDRQCGHFQRLPLQPPAVPLWSSTVCAPYPETPGAIRELALEHLIRPVRFREMIERMYADGFRVFLQVGAGNSLVGFVEDTLRGQPSAAMAVNAKQRSGLAQLRRTLAALFVEGAEVDLTALAPRGESSESARPRPSAPRHLNLDVPLIRLPPRPVAPTPLLQVPPEPLPQVPPERLSQVPPEPLPRVPPELSPQVAHEPLPQVPPEPPLQVLPEGLSSRLLRQFTESLNHIAQAQRDVLAEFQRHGPVKGGALDNPEHAQRDVLGEFQHRSFPTSVHLDVPNGGNWSPYAASRPRDRVEKRRLSIEGAPYLLDHCFYRQPAGWSEISDRYPVVPMTLLLNWLREAAESFAGQGVFALENVLAHRWLAVAPEVEISVRTASIEPNRIAVSIDGFAQGTAIIGEPDLSHWSAAPPLRSPAAPPVTAKALYRDRWMFHGRAYQGITALTATGSNGIDGQIAAGSTPGALLDCAGQLFGYWVMTKTERDRMAFPVHVERIDFLSPTPNPEDTLHCAVRVSELGERDVRADIWLWHLDGRPFCRIAGWQDRRFDTDDRLFDILRWPEKRLLAVRHAPGYFFVRDAWRTLASRELLARRYLGRREREQMDALPPRRQGPWLNGRIALKDAVRDHLWKRGAGDLFPVEIEVFHDHSDRPQVRGPFRETLQVSVAQVEGAAVARVGSHPVAIELERWEKISERLPADALSSAEHARLPPGEAWIARAVCAKRAVAKIRTNGVAIDPRRVLVQRVEGERLWVDGCWISTAEHESFIIAWSESI